MKDHATSLREIFLLFFRLGVISFGGPAAHTAMIRDEVVNRRAWMSDQRFLDLVGATNLIPGPNSTELAIFIGWERRGWAGLLTAGLAFILPATLLAGTCGWAYVRYGSVPEATAMLNGMKPAILGIIVRAIAGLAPAAAKSSKLRVLGVLALVLAATGVHELLVLFGIGLMASIWIAPRPRSPEEAAHPAMLPPLGPAAAVLASAAVLPLSFSGIFLVFLKIGALLVGSGYVLFAFLRGDLVERLGWLSETQLIDAIAVGQITPGPMFTTATFIGYVLAGPGGALAATLGIFLPAFAFVAASGPLLPKLRASPRASAFLDGINVAAIALMALVTVQLGRAAIHDIPTMIIGLVATVLMVRYKINSAWLVLGGALAGVLLGWIPAGG